MDIHDRSQRGPADGAAPGIREPGPPALARDVRGHRWARLTRAHGGPSGLARADPGGRRPLLRGRPARQGDRRHPWCDTVDGHLAPDDGTGPPPPRPIRRSRDVNDTDTELRRQLGQLRTLEPSPETVSERVRRRVTRRRHRRWAVRCAAVLALGVGAVTAHTLSSDPSGRPLRVITGQPGPRSSTSSSVPPDSTTRHDPGPAAAALVADPTSGLRNGSV